MLIKIDVGLVDAQALAVMRRVTIRHARRLQQPVACDLRTRVLLFHVLDEYPKCPSISANVATSASPP